MKTKKQKFWDRQAKRYDASEIQFDPVYKDVLSKTRKYLNMDDNVLDFGCATGTKTIQLAHAVKHIHGLDFSTEMIKEAIKKKAKANTRNVSFTQGTIYTNAFKEASFNTVIAYGIIQLLDDKEKVVQRIYDLLKPGGLFISTIACFKEKMTSKNKFAYKVTLLMKRLGLMPLHLNKFSFNDAKKLIENQNFQIIEAKTIFFGMTSSFIVARKL